MSIGICLKALNAINFKSKTDFFFEFLPQIILLTFIFGYMNVLIIIKWLTDYTGVEYLAPSIINTMINIPLNSGHINGSPFIGDASYNQSLSLSLLLIGVICVPLMLLPKPFILRS
jgi:V-type H+-transporting ATPase subunit a